MRFRHSPVSVTIIHGFVKLRALLKLGIGTFLIFAWD